MSEKKRIQRQRTKGWRMPQFSGSGEGGARMKETNLPIPMGCGNVRSPKFHSPVVGRVDITYFCTHCFQQQTVSVRWRSHHALPKGWRCRDIVPTHELPRRTDHIFSCSVGCRTALDGKYPPPRKPKWFASS